ncbi:MULTISPECIES: RNA polymerase sigma factor [Thermomonas]|uniref:RNA polymerase sigma factor n=1 Tax=Thermomonas TaxID=141948 RepID=UPI00041233F9|nr:MULTISPECIES: RNA polymerase sigma factor [Thermomonas]
MSHRETVREALPALLPRLRRMARALAGNAADADDLVQLALERALARVEQWRPEGRVDAWVFGILRNAWLDELRARARKQAIFVHEQAGLSVGEAGVERHLEALSVAEAMARLPPEQREVVALVLVEGMRYGEAARVLGVPEGTVTSRLSRARAALRDWLGDE